MEFRLLGPLEARAGGGLLPLGGAKQRALLALLLLNANRVVARERLVDELWGEQPPETAVESLQVYVSRLRKVLPKGALVTRPPGYALEVDPEAIDLQRFERLVAEAREAEPAQASRLLAEALALWRGPPLAEFSELFAQAESRRLEERHLAALEQHIAADLELGRHAEVVSELEGLVLDHPLRENLRGLQMLALYRAGRQADALAAYQAARAALVDELGLDPGQSLQRLEQAILRHDPSLDLPDPVAADAPETVKAPLPEAAPEVQVTRARKVVSVVFCDVVASTVDGGRLDPEPLQLVLSRYFEATTAVLQRHGGTVEKFIDDSVAAVFGVPVLHEDDAVRALRAAAELRTGIGELNRRLERDFRARLALRVGVDTGEVVTGTDGRLATGEAVNAAARLQQAAPPGEILIGSDTLALVREAVEVEELRPESAATGQRAAAYRLTGFEPRAPRVPRRLDVPMVGRTRERELLATALASAVERACCSLFTLLGTAGVGKSRLAREFLAGIDARVVEGRCLSYGEGITYSPVVDVVTQLEGAYRELLGDTPAAGAAIASLLGESATPTTPDEIAWSVRKLLEASARERPLVVVFDDVQWGEPTFLDLVEHVAYLSRDAPMLLLCLARPELLERRPGWGGRSVDAITVALEPLEAAEVDELIEHLLHGEKLEQDLGERIRSAAQGNPLFVEEMLAMVDESGNGEVLVPPTIKALLAARLDQLDPTEREVLGCGSVEGELFHRGAVETLAASSRPVERQLVALVRKELVRPDRSQILRDDGYRFRHLLIRDAAYEALPKATRAELHGRFADWIEEHGAELVEWDELVGFHLQQAHRYLEELGAPASETGPLGERAAGFLAAAGRRATVRGDYHTVAHLLERALELGVPDPREHLRLQVELGLALGQAGRGAEAEALLGSTVELATALGEQGLAARALVHLSAQRLDHDPGVGAPEMIPVAEDAIRTFEALGDTLGLAEAGLLLGNALARAGRVTESIAARERAIAHAQTAGATGIRRLIIGRLADRICFGPMPVEEGIGRLEELLRANRDDRMLEAVILRQLACAHAMAGRFDEARAHLEASTPVLDEVNLTHVWAVSRWRVSDTLQLVGDTAAAEQDLIAIWLHFRDTRGERSSSRALAATARLAQLCCDQGRWEEAAAYLSYGQEVDRSPPPYGNSYAFERLAARGRIAAHAGDHAEGVELARTAVELAAAFGSPNHEARMWLALAEVQRAAGNQAEADQAVERALELYERKGNITAAARVRAAAP
jgi:DNA-binding SARP family transcriptional activator